ncbi:MAG: MerR family transcriptional regulator, partial [Cetobacterium sp.]
MYDEFFTIGDVSKSTNIPISTLRYYDKIGLISPVFKNDETNYRYYSPKQIFVLKIINHMRNMGFSIEYIKSHFENIDYNHTLDLFQKVLSKKKSEIEKLKCIEKELIESHEKFKQNFELEQKIGIPFIENTTEVKGIIYGEFTQNFKELNKVLKTIDSFESQNNLHAQLRGFKVSFDNWGKNRYSKDYLIANMKEENANISIILPEGKYACVYGKGVFEEHEVVQNLLQWITENNYTSKDEFYITFTDLL